jgi:hypothetical protein
VVCQCLLEWQIDTGQVPRYHCGGIDMTARDRRRNLYEQISKAREADPEIFVRRANTPEALARQAYHSSLIEGCRVDLDELLQAAKLLANARG